jgi:DegV family protein with EDD domain
MDLDELAQWVTEHRLEVCHWFTVDTFDHLRHGGRVSAAAATMGTILQIKPLLHVDEKGGLQVAEKPRGSKRAMKTLLTHMEQGWMPETGKLVVIGHGDYPEGSEQLRKMIAERFPEAEIRTTDIGPVIGAHTGPGMLAVIYWGNNR